MFSHYLNRFMCGDPQAYHNELVNKVTRLEEENLRLKKEKVRNFVNLLLCIWFFHIEFDLWSLLSFTIIYKFLIHKKLMVG